MRLAIRKDHLQAIERFAKELDKAIEKDDNLRIIRLARSPDLCHCLRYLLYAHDVLYRNCADQTADIYEFSPEIYFQHVAPEQ